MLFIQNSLYTRFSVHKMADKHITHARLPAQILCHHHTKCAFFHLLMQKLNFLRPPPSFLVRECISKKFFFSFHSTVTAQYSTQWYMTKMRVDRKLSICITTDLCTYPNGGVQAKSFCICASILHS